MLYIICSRKSWQLGTANLISTIRLACLSDGAVRVTGTAKQHVLVGERQTQEGEAGNTETVPNCAVRKRAYCLAAWQVGWKRGVISRAGRRSVTRES